MRKVLVTGASGFIGRHTLPLLIDSGFTVHAVSSRGANFPDGVISHQCDLLADSQAAELLYSIRPTHLLHLAWLTEPGLYWTSPVNLQWVKSSITLLEAFAGLGGRRAVFAGTCAEYDWREGRLTETTTRLAPSSLYGASKHALQTVASAFARQECFSFSWGRMFFPFGPYEHHKRLIPSVVQALLSGEPALCTPGEQARDFLYVEDAASAFAALLQSEVTGAVNIGSGHATLVKEVIEAVAEILQRPDLVKLGALPAPDEPPVAVADTARLREEVRWQPAYSLREGLVQTVDWWSKRAHAVSGDQAERSLHHRP